ncbi:MAG: MBL fold metallo-hydrolase [Bacteroidia bacterium]|nr:MBL fold metallo-hydrolase [Bacteroidia bacterium]MCX7652807.1 MBL fold metallo-hydrolase [Bacteroidia bacterium]MDW8417228.1 MBL fold metallo-hydrolase [Bacteroidia bacterium]
MQLYAVETGRFALDGGAMFGVVPKTIWEKLIPPDERNRIPMSMRALLIEEGDRLILVDVGVGHKYTAKFADLYAIDHQTYTLSDELKKLGFSPADVTDVILTHLHFDHAGGSTERSGEKIIPTFPNARYYVQRSHWEWAHNPNPRERASFFPENYDPLVEHGQLVLLEGEQELLPGVFIRVVNGHTEGQQLVEVSYKGKIVLYAADLFPTSAHLPLPYVMAYDVRPLLTFQEREAYLPRLVQENIVVFYEHDPYVECTTVTEKSPGKYERGEVLRIADL